MAVADLFESLPLAHGPALQNRILLAPLTNLQSNPDGTASQDDLDWIRMISAGGYSMTMTCAANVQANGKAFPGQLGIYDDRHLAGLTEMARIIRSNGSASSVQLHHGGIRALGGPNGRPVGPSPINGARALSTAEVEQLRDDFIAAAARARRAGFDGVELHGAFGFVIAQFLSPELNHRTDRYGGDVEGRSRFLFELLEGVRAVGGPDFQLGLRLSLERYGVRLGELRDVVAEAMRRGFIDYLDLAPWDIAKVATEPGFEGRTLLSVFTELPRGQVRLGASGHVMSAEGAASVLDEHSCDFVMIGRAGILEPDFPQRVQADHTYVSPALPVTESYLRNEVGLSSAFAEYMWHYKGFLTEEPAA